MPDYLDIDLEERSIQLGLSALLHYQEHPVLHTDRKTAALISDAIQVLIRQRDRYRGDVMELRSDWDRIFEAGVSLQEARTAAKLPRPWWKLGR